MGLVGGGFVWIEGGEHLVLSLPCHDHWFELQPVGSDEAIVVDFEEVESVIVREADESIASPSQQMSL